MSGAIHPFHIYNMNTKYSSIRLIIAGVVIAAIASIAQAGPGPQHWETLRNTSQFEATKPGESLYQACSACKTISAVETATAEQIASLYKEGGSVICPSCKLTTKIVQKQSRNDAVLKTELVYVDAEGKESAFIVKALANM